MLGGWGHTIIFKDFEYIMPQRNFKPILQQLQKLLIVCVDAQKSFKRLFGASVVGLIFSTC